LVRNWIKYAYSSWINPFGHYFSSGM
jgi:hypothetical protein